MEVGSDTKFRGVADNPCVRRTQFFPDALVPLHVVGKSAAALRVRRVHHCGLAAVVAPCTRPSFTRLRCMSRGFCTRLRSLHTVQPSLRDGVRFLAIVPGVETPGYYQNVLRTLRLTPRGRF